MKRLILIPLISLTCLSCQAMFKKRNSTPSLGSPDHDLHTAAMVAAAADRFESMVPQVPINDEPNTPEESLVFGVTPPTRSQNLPGFTQGTSSATTPACTKDAPPQTKPMRAQSEPIIIPKQTWHRKTSPLAPQEQEVKDTVGWCRAPKQGEFRGWKHYGQLKEDGK